MSVETEIFPPARFNKAADGWNFSGAAMRNSNPNFAAVQIHEFATLHAPSPMNATVLPAIGPRNSLNVKMSAMIWHGCSSSVSALMVGTFEYFANSSTSVRMLVVRQRVDGRNVRIFRELLDVVLCEGADDRAVNHPAQHACGVLDRLAAAKLDVVGVEKHWPPAKFVDADLERNPRARGRFGKHQRPGLAGQRLGFVMTTLAFEHGGIAQNFFKIRARQFFQ